MGCRSIWVIALISLVGCGNSETVAPVHNASPIVAPAQVNSVVSDRNTSRPEATGYKTTVKPAQTAANRSTPIDIKSIREAKIRQHPNSIAAKRHERIKTSTARFKQGKKAMATLDTNGDELLSMEELKKGYLAKGSIVGDITKHIEEVFNRADLNKDGFLDLVEADKADFN